tara:strand:- start:327 stop:506 length:180 start_codon:yes stop_codon:yes gene_type:complete
MEHHEKRTQDERKMLGLKRELDSIDKCCRLVVWAWFAWGLFSVAVLIRFICTETLPMSF